ncbi:MAG: SDR family oxidoreductase [Xanthomonadales bacterium]|jgi:NAD(P)-dependent dehydrogenase (short-subunit alcohol dehydrogenase family)|nr:SDR family oxidoreductase [Xanthomonadales bacterium]
MPTAVITGANRGIGLEFTRRYLEAGWRVFAVNRGHSDALRSLADNDRLALVRGELTHPSDLSRIAEHLANETIDLLINNAGIMGTDTFRHDTRQRQGLYDFDREEWRAVFEINLFTPMHLIALLRPRLATGARLVTISSSMGSIAGNEFGGWYAYRASKAAVNSLMKSVALELGESALAVALHPGWVRTDMGGENADIDVQTSVAGMMNVIEGLEAADNGAFIGFDGKRLDY